MSTTSLQRARTRGRWRCRAPTPTLPASRLSPRPRRRQSRPGSSGSRRPRCGRRWGRSGSARAVAAMIEAALAVKADESVPPATGDLLRGLAFVAAAAGGEDAARALPATGDRRLSQGPGLRAAVREGRQRGDQRAGRLRRERRSSAASRGQLQRPTAVEAVDKAIERGGGATRHRARRVRGARRCPTSGSTPPAPAAVALGEHIAILDGTGALRFRTRQRPDAQVGAEGRASEAHPEELAELKRTAKDIKATATGAAPAARAAADRGPRLDRRRRGASATSTTGSSGRSRAGLIWTASTASSAMLEDAPARTARRSGSGTRSTPRPRRSTRWRRDLEDGARSRSRSSRPTARSTCSPTPSARPSTYSNRFAAHVLRQHQIAALAATRGWRYRLQGGFDSGDEHRDARAARRRCRRRVLGRAARRRGRRDRTRPGSSPTSSPTRCASPTRDGEPVPLETIPRSRLQRGHARRRPVRRRDAASATTRPGRDQGDRRYRDYWSELRVRRARRAGGDPPRRARAPAAQARDRATSPKLDGRFLRVRGTRRTYKIHLGSGEHPHGAQRPVPVHRRAAARAASKVYLPFEGDPMLALILSKAFLLADDDKITDPTILSQIETRR